MAGPSPSGGGPFIVSPIKGVSLYASVSELQPKNDVATHVRYGCFLGSVPVSQRVGDYVHCASRIVNAILKRLAQHAPAPARGDLGRLIQGLVDDLACVPIIDRMYSRYKRQGTLDLSQSRFFIMSEERISGLVALVERYASGISLTFNSKALSYHVVVRILLTSLHKLHNLWHCHSYFTDEQLAQYDAHILTFQKAWVALKWKPTIWVHWTIAHSSFFVHKYRSLYLFSSIPSEKRHQSFKQDLRHCFQGWKLSQSVLHSRGLVYCVSLSGLDLGLMFHEEAPGKTKKRLRL